MLRALLESRAKSPMLFKLVGSILMGNYLRVTTLLVLVAILYRAVFDLIIGGP